MTADCIGRASWYNYPATDDPINHQGETTMKRVVLTAGVFGLGAVLLACLPALAGEKKVEEKKADGGWVQLFNGKDLTGWKTHPKAPGKWYVKDGILHSGGKETSHLFSERDDYQNFH